MISIKKYAQKRFYSQFYKWNSRRIRTINENHTEQKGILDFSKLHFSGRGSLKKWEIYFTITQKCVIFFVTVWTSQKNKLSLSIF